MTPAILAQANDLRAAGKPPFVICEMVSGKVVASVPHNEERLSGATLVEAARRARGEVA